MKYRVKHVMEYGSLRAITLLLNLLPYRCALFVGWLIAGLAHWAFRFRTAEVRARIRSAFGSRYTRGQVNRIAWISWRNTVFNMIEMLRIARSTKAWTEKVFDASAYIEQLTNHCSTGRGAIIAAPHTGNWEMGGVACFRGGVPVFNIAAEQRNPLVNAYFNRLRSKPGIDSIARGSGDMRSVVRKLKQGGVLCILPDSRMREEELLLPFLNGEANLGRGMALFARMLDIPIFAVTPRRIGWARHELVPLGAILPDKSLDKDVDITRMTRIVVELLDAAIQKDPCQWFWYNKRWVLDPVEEKATQE